MTQHLAGSWVYQKRFIKTYTVYASNINTAERCGACRAAYISVGVYAGAALLGELGAGAARWHSPACLCLCLSLPAPRIPGNAGV